MTINELERIASQVRRDIIRMVHGCQSGHPGGSLGATDIVTALYFDQMQIDPAHFRMDGNGEDMFFLSNGHTSPMFYSILARRGYFPVSELATFRRLGTRLQGHPTTAEGLPGVRIASGSLGQGLSVAIGAAQAKRLNGDKHLVFVLMGDGEQEEGQIWEAAMYAPAKKVDNLIAIIDYNKKQIDGSTDDVLNLGDLRAKYETFGWEVIEVSGNTLLLMLAGTIFVLLKPLILNALNLVGTSTDALALHTKLVDAIERGDEDDAQDQILKHLALSMRNFEYSLQVGARKKKA